MAVATSNNFIERLQGERQGVYAHLTGEVTLEPSNYYTEWPWSTKNEYGDPLDWFVGVPPSHDGINFFVSKTSKGASTMSCQNSEPEDPEDPEYVVQTPLVPGHAPVGRSMAKKSGMAPPQLKLIVKKKPITKLGLKAGTYPVSYYLENKEGERSGMADPVFVTVTQGQRLRVTMPSSFEEGVHRVTLCIGKDGGNVNTCKAYKSWPVKKVPPTYDVHGPRVQGKRGPSRNETARGKADKPKVRRKDSMHTLKKGIYEIEVTEQTEIGEGELSDTVTIEVSEDEPRTALDVEPQNIKKSSKGYNVYVRVDGEQMKALDTTAARTAQAYTDKSVKNTTVDGTVLNDNTGKVQGGGTMNVPGSGSTGTNSTGGSGGNSQVETDMEENTDSISSNSGDSEGETSGMSSTGLASSATPEEDESAVPEPSGALEAVELLASENPIPPGDYYATYSKTRGLFESMPAPKVKYTIRGSGGVATEAARLIVPHPINLIENASFKRLDADDFPEGHYVNKGSGNVTAEDGVLELDTNGNRTTADTPVHASNLFEVDRNKDYLGAAEIEVDWSAGTFEVLLEEFSLEVTDEQPSESALAAAKTRTTSVVLKSLSASGLTRYLARMGSWGTEWHENTLSARIVHRISNLASTGTSRSLKARVFDWRFTTFKGGVRKYDAVGGFYDPDPPKEQPIPHRPYKIVSLPPKSKKKDGNDSDRQANYIDLLRFLGTPPSTPAALPAGWTKAATSHAFIIGQIDNASRIEGDFGYRFSKTTTSSGFNSVWKNYDTTEGRTSLAVRQLWRIPTFQSLPVRSNVPLMGISRFTSAPTATRGFNGDLCTVVLQTDGKIRLDVRDPGTGVLRYNKISTLRVSPGETFDLELRVKGGNTNAGTATLLGAKNGGRRAVIAEITGARWSGYRPNQLVVGPYALTDPAGTYYLTSDTWVVSNTSVPNNLDATVPPGESIEEIDRPLIAGTLYGERNFVGGSTTPGTLSGAPANTVVAAIAEASKTPGAGFGLRVSDSTASTQNLYYTETLDTPRGDSFAKRFDFRMPTRPTSGEVSIARFQADASVILCEVIVDTSGNIYVQPRHAAGGTAPTRTLIAKTVAANTWISIEVILLGLNTAQGIARAYVHRDGAERREFMMDHTLVDWRSASVALYRVGGMSVTGTIASATFSFDFDNIYLTEAGAFYHEEYAEDGRSIEQCYLLLMPGQPKLDGLFLNGGERAVEPGEIYTAGIKARWSGIPSNKSARPFCVVGHHRSGKKKLLACLVDNAQFSGGATTTSDWLHLTHTLPAIPEGYYKISWECRDMCEGEYVCQSPSFTHDTEAALEVTYPPYGYIRELIDTWTPQMNRSLAFIGRVWRKLSNRTDEPEGTSTETHYWSSPHLPASEFTPEQTDPDEVPQGRYLHTRVQLHTTNPLETPVLHAANPRCVYTIDLSDTLLMDDESELPGGVALGEVLDWKMSDPVDYIELETGEVIRHDTGFSIAEMPGVTMQCFTHTTYKFLMEWWGKRTWVIETPKEKILVRPKGKLEEPVFTDGSYILDPRVGNVNGWWEWDTTPDFVVLGAVPLPWAHTDILMDTVS